MISGGTRQTRALLVFLFNWGEQFTDSCNKVRHPSAQLDLLLILFDTGFKLLSFLVDASDLILQGASLGLELPCGVQNIVV